MKTQRRHELQTNELADWLGQKIEAIRPYTKAILGVAVVVAAGLFAVLFLSAHKSREQASSWQQLYASMLARDVDKLEQLAQANGDSTAGLWAWQNAASVLLEEGTRLLHVDRANANRQLGRARNAYQSVIEQTQDDLLKPCAILGLAQCYEALNNYAEAEKQYDRVIEGWPGTAVEAVARERRAFLQQSSTREFLAWFDRQEPPAAGPDASSMLDAFPGGLDPSGAGEAGADDIFPRDPLEPPGDDIELDEGITPRAQSPIEPGKSGSSDSDPSGASDSDLIVPVEGDSPIPPRLPDPSESGPDPPEGSSGDAAGDGSGGDS
jgi:hypothetical protein